jgi:hypothetical protein
MEVSGHVTRRSSCCTDTVLVMCGVDHIYFVLRASQEPQGQQPETLAAATSALRQSQPRGCLGSSGKRSDGRCLCLWVRHCQMHYQMHGDPRRFAQHEQRLQVSSS